MKRNIEEAKKHLKKLREIVAKSDSPFKGMTIEQAVKKMRKTREELWEEKLALRSRHK